jgi:uncharacterized protein YkwD
MIYTILNRNAVSALAIGTFLSTASLVFGETLVIPPQLVHPGLLFASPITFKEPVTIDLNPTTVEFKTADAIQLQVEQKKDAATVTGDVAQVMPTPTVYVAPPVTVTEETQPSPTPSPELFTPAPETPTAAATNTPVVTQVSNPGGLSSDKLFTMANAYRQSKGLPPFEKDDRVCSLAASRAPEVNAEIASGTMHKGLQSRNLPYWNTENIISMNSEETAFNWWINDTIHRDAIEGNYKYSCTACSGNACAEEFTNFVSK